MKKFALRTLISLTFIGLLFYLMRDDLPLILATLKNVDRGLFLISFLLSLTAVVVIAKRLQLIFEAEDVPLSLAEASSLTFVGYFFNNFLPTSVGGDIVKAMSASRLTGERVKSVTSVLLDRLFGLSTFILIPSVSLLIVMKSIDNPAVSIIVYAFLSAALFSFFVLFNKSVARRFRFMEKLLDRFHFADLLKKIYQGMHNFKRHKLVVLQAMLLSMVGQSVSICVLYLMALALGAPRVHILYFFLLVPVVHLLSMLPSLNGLGIREGAYIYFLSPYIGKETAAALSVLWLAQLFFLSLIGGIVYLVRQDYHVQFKKAGALRERPSP